MPQWQPWQFEGNFDYRSGTGTATIDLPDDAHLRRVSVVAGTAAASTIVLAGGGTITVPAGFAFDEQITGTAINWDVIIAGGAPQAYYVAWVI